ncbi:MAG: hypothetical protein ACLFQV_01390 [Vulcanimicrobiota bacterium]
MSWFKNLFNRITGKNKEENKNQEPELQVQPLEKQIRESIDKYVSKADIKTSCLFFDPQETKCFAYLLNDDEAILLDSFPVEGWKNALENLKQINNKQIEAGQNKYTSFTSLLFTNLGERVALVLSHPSESGEEKLLEKKRRAIRLINRHKPATALTNKNIENLLTVFEENKDRDLKKFYAILVEDEVFTKEEMVELEKDQNLRTILEKPVSRKQMVKSLARWLGATYTDVELLKINEEVARKIPEEKAREMKILPYSLENNNIKVAYWKPFDRETVKFIEQYFDNDIFPVMSSEEDIRYELEKIYF